METPLVSLKGVYKSIDGEEILKDISLDVFKGEFLSVMGASGSGKSSLLYILGLIDKPTKGEVMFEGKRIDFSDDKKLSALRNRKLGFVFQFHYLLPEFTALENIMVPMLKAGVGKSEAKERAYRLLEVVGLSGKEERKPYQLSGGEQQRVAIGRALANEPTLILADEPTGNLDSKNTEAVMDIFLELNRDGKTIVMVTHEEYLAKRAQRGLIMKDGSIVV
ncbi:lipoprotein-releasing system ATP-binding protein [Hydrogenivirga caldilitoris]|uniref:Lipoprotein-releasing system ATP-binding protein n=1 Tax=Hydrogenivirga caldilitoris TaxID=246264 RepID=A0A497XLV2_9AQUI|nr:ABC transporter ATP-binding protein [Hydrogenivirga caldilitoris]RLJ69856.1 lipoprotein-releasing system ATP-binding protein [Hydrogenivirga caldilitoris]